MACSNNYIKLPNQGNISSNLRLLYEMQLASDYADSQGYYTKRDIAAKSLQMLYLSQQVAKLAMMLLHHWTMLELTK